MSLCERQTPHVPHFFRRGDWPKLMDMESCPGIDSPTITETLTDAGITEDNLEAALLGAVLAPEQDRPVTEDTPDWSPDVLHLSDAAALIIRAHQTLHPDRRPSASYAGAMVLWRELTGLDEPEALTYAYQIGTAHPPVTAVLPPF